MLKKTKPRIPGPTMLLLARLLDLEQPETAAAAAAAWSVGAAAVRSLHSPLDRMPAARRGELEGQAAMLCTLLGDAFPSRRPPPPALAAELLARISTNVHTITDEEMQPIGARRAVWLGPWAPLGEADVGAAGAIRQGSGSILLPRSPTTTATPRPCSRTRARRSCSGRCALSRRATQ
jgi:hypothetical protein